MNGKREIIMIVDDNIANLTIGRNALKSMYEVYLAASAKQLFEMLDNIKPDLILLDVEMPDMDGYEAIVRLQAMERFTNVPVIFLTAQSDVASELKGFDLGAVDYISKPVSPPLLLKRIEHQLVIVRQHKMIRHHIDNLAAIVGEKVGEVISLQNVILGTIADLVEFRDRFTGGHIARTQMYMKAMIGGLLANRLYSDITSDWDMDSVLQAAQLHDVGKIAIPDAILNKPARLTPDEFEIMKTHVTVGIDAMDRIICKTKNHAFLRHTYNIVASHHERWDGSGYPAGLKGEAIPLEGRLMAVAVVYDALVSSRPYKEQYSHAHAVHIIREGSGISFDPVLVELFLSLETTFQHISRSNASDRRTLAGLLTLTRNMEVGVPAIDMQHRELIERLNNVITQGVQSASREETQKTLDFLEDYVITHFRDEEELQQRFGYPKYEWHKQQHQFFFGEFQSLKDEFAANGASIDFMQKLNTSISNWIVTHIQAVDVEFGQYYQIRAQRPRTL